MALRGIRGATTAEANTREAILSATRELLEELVHANDLVSSEIVSAYFTVTADLDAAFPAAAARQMGWTEVALLDAQAPKVQGDVVRCIRVLVHREYDSQSPIQHIYLRGAQSLRPEWIRTSRPAKGAE